MEFLGFFKGNKRRVTNSMTMGLDTVVHTESIETPGGAKLKRQEGKLETEGDEGREEQAAEAPDPEKVIPFPEKR